MYLMATKHAFTAINLLPLAVIAKIAMDIGVRSLKGILAGMNA